MPVQYLVGWTGGRIGSGVTVFNLDITGDFTDWAAVNTAIGAWFTNIAARMPNDVSFTFPSEVRSVDTATGELIGVIGIPQRAGVTGGSASTQWSAPAGRLVKWTTGAVVAGRRLSGHTYLVPTAADSFSEGSVTASTLTADQAAHSALISALATSLAWLCVWSRTHGVLHRVTSGATLSRPTTLRSRND